MVIPDQRKPPMVTISEADELVEVASGEHPGFIYHECGAGGQVPGR